MNKAAVETILKKHGLKITPARRALLLIFEKNQKPLSPQDLSKKMKHLGADQATIYRNLESLEKVGLLKKVLIDDNKAYYELNFGHHHHHLICSNCKQIEDIQIEDETWIEKKIKDKNFTVLNHSFEFFGLCKACVR